MVYALCNATHVHNASQPLSKNRLLTTCLWTLIYFYLHYSSTFTYSYQLSFTLMYSSQLSYTLLNSHLLLTTLIYSHLLLCTLLNFHILISNSLIIHAENTKEINTETEFGYVMKHLHKIKPTLISIFLLNTNLFEMLHQTLGRVFHQDIQTPRSC